MNDSLREYYCLEVYVYGIPTSGVSPSADHQAFPPGPLTHNPPLSALCRIIKGIIPRGVPVLCQAVVTMRYWSRWHGGWTGWGYWCRLGVAMETTVWCTKEGGSVCESGTSCLHTEELTLHSLAALTKSECVCETVCLVCECVCALFAHHLGPE